MVNSDQAFNKFLLLWTGQFVAAIGSGLSAFGLSIYVFEQTGKASAVALVSLLAFAPALLLGAWAGVLADRYDRRILMAIGDGFSALGLIFILACLYKGEAQLWQICLGVTVSSVFVSLLDPAYDATITDLLSPEQYTKASGLVQVAGAAKFLISPILAGFLLRAWSIKLLLLIDICTIFVTLTSVFVVRKGLATIKQNQSSSFLEEFQVGWSAVYENRGVFLLVIMSAVLTFFIGFVQTLFTPMILAFADSATLGVVETVAASGMLITSLIVGGLSIKKGHAKLLSFSLFFAGLFVALIGLKENIFLIGGAGFLFFAMLPFANTSLDYLVRTNIDNQVQGRAWGLIGVISQFGYVLAYAISGLLADYIFTPLLLPSGLLVKSAGRIFGVGPGRGIGLLVFLSGILIGVSAIVLNQIKAVRSLEKPVPELGETA